VAPSGLLARLCHTFLVLLTLLTSRTKYEVSVSTGYEDMRSNELRWFWGG